MVNLLGCRHGLTESDRVKHGNIYSNASNRTRIHCPPVERWGYYLGTRTLHQGVRIAAH